MKHPHTRLLVSIAVGLLTTAGLSTATAQTGAKPTVITPPAIKDGSNWSRAPFPAARQFDDTKPADGKAIDETGANPRVANPDPAPPAPRAATLQPPAPAVVGEPGLLPTGRTTVAIATPLDSATFAPSIRSTMYESREQTLADMEARLKASEKAMSALHKTESQMSADAKQQFNAAADEAKTKAHALRQEIKSARKASSAQWESTRDQLAADYEAYAAALAGLGIVVRTGEFGAAMEVELVNDGPVTLWMDSSKP